MEIVTAVRVFFVFMGYLQNSMTRSYKDLGGASREFGEDSVRFVKFIENEIDTAIL